LNTGFVCFVFFAVEVSLFLMIFSRVVVEIEMVSVDVGALFGEDVFLYECSLFG